METGDKRRLEANRLVTSAPLLIMKGDYSSALDSFTSALRIGEEIHSVELQASCFCGLANVLVGMNRQGEAIPMARKAIELAKGKPTPEMTNLRCRSHSFLAMSLAKLGKTSAALEEAAEAEKLCAYMHSPKEEMAHCAALAEIYDVTGDGEKREKWLRKTIEMAKATRNVLVESSETFMLGKLLFENGVKGKPNREVEDLFRRSIAMLLELPHEAAAAQARVFLGHYYKSIGKRRLARKHLDTALRAFRRVKPDACGVLEEELAEINSGSGRSYWKGIFESVASVARLMGWW